MDTKGIQFMQYLCILHKFNSILLIWISALLSFVFEVLVHIYIYIIYVDVTYIYVIYMYIYNYIYIYTYELHMCDTICS